VAVLAEHRNMGTNLGILFIKRFINR